jgi:hypothetical protein
LSAEFLEDLAMSRRLQISDKNNNLLTIQMDLAWTMNKNVSGHWLPDYPGKVRAGSGWDNNPWKGVIPSGEGLGFSIDAVCYTIDSQGSIIPVLRFNGFMMIGTWASVNLLNSGSGYLYHTGVQAMAEGIFTWKNLDAVVADSADDSSDSDSDGSDDSSDVSDSANA